MTAHVALLRAVNVAGRNRVSMAELRELLAKLGFADVKSVLQSGNLVFDGRGRRPSSLENILEQAAKDHLRLETTFFVRTAKEWAKMVVGNPFPSEAKRDPSHLLVMLLKRAPDRKKVTALQRAIVGREVLGAKGRHVYIVYPDGVGRSRLTNALIERKLGTEGTARNWNTVLRLASLAR